MGQEAHGLGVNALSFKKARYEPSPPRANGQPLDPD